MGRHAANHACPGGGNHDLPKLPEGHRGVFEFLLLLRRAPECGRRSAARSKTPDALFEGLQNRRRLRGNCRISRSRFHTGSFGLGDFDFCAGADFPGDCGLLRRLADHAAGSASGARCSSARGSVFELAASRANGLREKIATRSLWFFAGPFALRRKSVDRPKSCPPPPLRA